MKDKGEKNLRNIIIFSMLIIVSFFILIIALINYKIYFFISFSVLLLFFIIFLCLNFYSLGKSFRQQVFRCPVCFGNGVLISEGEKVICNSCSGKGIII